MFDSIFLIPRTEKSSCIARSMRFEFSRVATQFTARDTFENANRRDDDRTRISRKDRTEPCTVSETIFLPFGSWLLTMIVPDGNQRADDVAIAPSNPVGVLFTDAGCARLSRGAEKPKETSSKPVSSWNWFRTRRKPPAVMFRSPVGSLVKPTAARSSRTSLERIPNRDETYAPSSTFDRKRRP